MIELGKKQSLYIVKKTPVGLFVNESPDELLNSMTLSKKEIEDFDAYEVGDQIEVYCYQNHEGKMAATFKPPILCNGEIGILKAVSSNNYGAFMEWGYDKDVLLPHGEQREPVKAGHKVLVKLYTDKSGRICATTKIKKSLELEHDYKEGDIVSGVIYDMNEDMGAFVAVDCRYFGLILSNEVMPNMALGMKVEGRVTKLREDGKMNITLNKRIDQQMDEDSLRILEALQENEGFLPYHDKSDSEVIKRVFNMSKKAFKRAIGRLYRSEKIDIKPDGIHIKE